MTIVVGRKKLEWFPKDTYIVIPGTHEDVMLHGID